MRECALENLTDMGLLSSSSLQSQLSLSSLRGFRSVEHIAGETYESEQLEFRMHPSIRAAAHLYAYSSATSRTNATVRDLFPTPLVWPKPKKSKVKTCEPEQRFRSLPSMALSSDTAASPLSFGISLTNVRRNKRGRKGGAWGNGRVQRLDVLLEGGEFEASSLSLSHRIFSETNILSAFQVGREEPIFGPGDALSGNVSVVTVGTLRFKVGSNLARD